MIDKPITVSQLNHTIKNLIDNDLWMSNILVAGEISNVRYYQAGNQIYFTLKDEGSQISCVLFSSTIQRLKFKPVDGLKVVVRGRVTVYEKRGSYSVQVFFMEPEGIGALANAFEQLKEKLAKEGLFSAERKKRMPLFPECIGVIAAESGAAIKDIISITLRRCPLTQIKLFPAVVQGAMAPDSIVSQLRAAQRDPEIELIILARGGGSKEDLWAFNEEIVARAIADCKLPTVSSIGHEIDFTLADFVADLRAATPSAAAELVVPDLPQLLTNYRKRLDLSLKQSLASTIQRFEYLKGHLNLLDPRVILKRGYSITRKNGKVIKKAQEAENDDMIITMLSEGTITSQVMGK